MDRLRTQIAGEVDDGLRRRAEYSSDASNYRVLPTAVVFPRRENDLAATLAYATDNGLTVTARGAGTSVAGNAIGPGLVLDFSRHMSSLLQIDPDSRTARVQPGLVLGDLQRAAAAHGLRFGPDPSTQNRCTVGGMIGNNACGPRAVSWGRTVDNVRELTILDGTGTRRTLGTDLAAVPGLDGFVRSNLGVIRTELGQFERQASGYSLEHLLPERGGDVAKTFVGTEGTCGLIVDATVDLVEIPTATAVAVLGYPDMPSAAADVAGILAAAPAAIEGLDARLVDVVRRHGRPVPDLPRGSGWLFVETTGTSLAEAESRATELCRASAALDTRVVTDRAEAAALWRIRADGAGLSGRTASGEPAWPGWEDAAVPQANLAPYLREFEELMAEHRVDGFLYGHFGDGCIHVRLDLPITDAPQRFRAFLVDAATLVAKHGGSLSGEHGDGRARSELLPLMYSGAVLEVFGQFKSLFDPQNLLNPGVLVDPVPVDADLRVAGLASVPPVDGLALAHDRGDLGMAAHRCVGVGKCRADTSATGGFMCPSYLATGDEKDSTRGRARVLQEVINGSALTDGWASPELEESLDLCLSCKACSSDCPAGVDMAAYKSEVLFRRYRGKRRPVSHYVLGQLPRWVRLGRRAPRLFNRLAGMPRLSAKALRAAGIDSRRSIPTLAEQTFRQWWDKRDKPTGTGKSSVMLWIDTFTDAFTPGVGIAAVEILETAGYTVRIPEKTVCCGLTWITTGQLDGARKQLRRTVDTLAEHVRAGGQIVGLEPSCTAVLRSDLVELLPGDSVAEMISVASHTLAEFLSADPDWEPPRLDGTHLVVQPHCHHHAVMGFDTDRRLLEQSGATVDAIAGCCGLAGNFGMEKGHYDVSVAVAENGLLPALRAAQSESVLVADGFSCRTQAAQLAGREGIHLAELLRATRPRP